MAKKQPTRDALDARFGIRLPKDMMRWCRERAAKKRIPISFVLRELVLAAMEAESDDKMRS